jgi:hypothetical protein
MEQEPSAEIKALFEEARAAERMASAEYWRILKVFTDLVVHRQLPDEKVG